MNNSEKLAAAKKWLAENPPKNPPIIGIYSNWPRNECCYPSVIQALQAMRNMR